MFMTPANAIMPTMEKFPEEEHLGLAKECTEEYIHPVGTSSPTIDSTTGIRVDADATYALKNAFATATKPEHKYCDDRGLKLQLLSLPLDSLHTIASFLNVQDWATFGLVCRDASLTCRDVLRKVKMHAFHCAVEVVSAWVSLRSFDLRIYVFLLLCVSLCVVACCLSIFCV
jgi:hypothetical protein